MTQWQRTLNLLPEWSEASDDELSLKNLSKVIADRLENLVPFTGDLEYIEDEKEILIEDFRNLADSDDEDVEEFDYFMENLYDWGDMVINVNKNNPLHAKKVCWIKTF